MTFLTQMWRKVPTTNTTHTTHEPYLLPGGTQLVQILVTEFKWAPQTGFLQRSHVNEANNILQIQHIASTMQHLHTSTIYKLYAQLPKKKAYFPQTTTTTKNYINNHTSNTVMAEKVVYDLHYIKVADFNPKQGSMTLVVDYTKNGQQQSITKKHTFTEANLVVTSIINDIKKKEQLNIADDDDILSGYQVVDLKDQEGVEEKLTNFIYRMNERYRLMKKMKDAKKYMQMFDDMKIAKMSLH